MQSSKKSLAAFPKLEGLIFADPDGEFILFEAPAMEDFNVQLAGAKMPILISSYQTLGLGKSPHFMELTFHGRYVLSICLEQAFSITAIGVDPKELGALKHHLSILAEKFNKEIV